MSRLSGKSWGYHESIRGWISVLERIIAIDLESELLPIPSYLRPYRNTSGVELIISRSTEFDESWKSTSLLLI